ncbi:hypothetical protein CLV32_0070 [Pedobacter duraquae]|uniref:Uncharacterized protein n=1 Tax=Pedobacter duraquae TaxID=425511 RepID=A0A4R6IPC6_9SPHI|nr:hypothetical protein CLV32_0070 [Pedobacter duraquae]
MKYGKTLVASVIFFVLVFLTTYLSTQYLSLQPSSSCMDCSYMRDVLLFSITSIFVIPLIVWIQKRAKLGKVVLSIVIGAAFVAIVFFNMLNLFQERVSSWSSYSTGDELLAVLLDSYLYLTVGASITFFVFYKILKVR